MKNGQIWKDTDGNDIQAHGGCIIEHKGIFYWYGENKGLPNSTGGGPNTANEHRVDVIGVSCYSSKDLVNWKNEGIVLPADKDNPNSPMHPSKVAERPKVIYNEKNNNFVLWLHVDSADYTYHGVGIAVSDSPTGPFKLIDAKQPNRQGSMDMTLFVDEDKTAYLVHTKDWDKTMNIARLNDDYTDVDGMYVSVMEDQEREAPAVCLYNGVYYMITSGCSGWLPNSMLYSTCDFIMGKWKLIDNPCEGENYRKSFFGQSTYIFNVGEKYFLMMDHWQRENLQKSGYSILPITFDGNGNITIVWEDEWNGICPIRKKN